MSTETREDRQSRINARVQELRAQADALQTKAEAIDASLTKDYAFWTQPAYLGTSVGRAFANRRDRERSKMAKAAEMMAEARSLRSKADSMERTGAVMAGDAAARRQERIASVAVSPGDMVDTTHYGVRKVLKVNRATILVESAFGSLKVNKEFVKKVA